MAWRKRERIDLLRTIAIVTATVNPEKAQSALSKLIEEMFPEIANDRTRAVDRALEIMEEEKNKVYSVTPVGQSLKKTPMGKLAGIMRRNRRPGPRGMR